MATLEERIAALETQLAALTAPPTEYYTLSKTGEELDALLGNSVRFDTAQGLTDAQKTQARNNISAMQGIESADYSGCYYVLNGSTVEWINAPMQLGVEYRTTERYLGKPVYAQLMDLGNAPAQGSMKTVATPSNSENQQLVWAQLTYYGITFPKYKTDGTLSMWIYVASGSSQIQIYSPGEDRSASGVIRALVKYTKTTD